MTNPSFLLFISNEKFETSVRWIRHNTRWIMSIHTALLMNTHHTKNINKSYCFFLYDQLLFKFWSLRLPLTIQNWLWTWFIGHLGEVSVFHETQRYFCDIGIFIFVMKTCDIFTFNRHRMQYLFGGFTSLNLHRVTHFDYYARNS